MMKTKRTVFILTLLLTTALALLPVNAQEVHIPDANLASAIRGVLGLGEGARITAAAMRELTELEASDRGIADLTGLEHAVNLEGLWLGGSAVRDISALANLTNLEDLDLHNTGLLWHANALANLTKLKRLNFQNSFIGDISGLANLTQLEWLNIRSTRVGDISVLANLTQLETLSIGGNVLDISPLANLTQLKRLYLGSNVLNISALANLTQLERLDFSNTEPDISVLANLTKLKWLDLHNTNVSDISVLANLTKLKWLDLNNTNVSDISALVNLPQLETLALARTPLSPASQALIPTLEANGTTVWFSAAPPPPPPPPPAWEFQWYIHPDYGIRDPDKLISFYRVTDIGFYGNSKVIYGMANRIYSYDLSSHRFQGRVFWDLNKRVDHVEVSEAHDIVVFTYDDGLYLRRASDLSARIDSVGLPGSAPDTLSMGPRTNYVIVSDSLLDYTRIYDLWENKSWGLNRVRHKHEQEGMLHVDILNYDYAYAIRGPGVAQEFVTELRYRTFQLWTGPAPALRERFYPVTYISYPWEKFVAVAASGATIAGITDQGNLHVWGWFENRNLSSSSEHSTIQYPPTSFQFTPNGKILTWISRVGTEIVFWDTTTKETVAVVEVEPGDSFSCHAFSKDGKTMAVGMLDGSVGLYKWTGANALAAPAKEAETEISQPTALLSNYPNPFNPETWIPYRLSDPAEVTVSIYSVDGRLVRRLELGQMPAGVYSDKERAAYWDGRNASGEPVASGVYFYTLQAGDFKATRKMVIRK